MSAVRTGSVGFHRRGEAGSVNLVIPAMIVVVILGVYLALKFVPPYSADYGFKHFLMLQTRNAFEWTRRRSGSR